jgi:mRNA interferase MazF
VVIVQGEVWWADLADPVGSEPGFRRPVVVVQGDAFNASMIRTIRRPVVVVQGDAFNASMIRTIVCVSLTSNVKWADAPGNVLLPARATGLPKPSVANVTQLMTLDRAVLTERAGRLSASSLELVLAGIDTMLGRG